MKNPTSNQSKGSPRRTGSGKGLLSKIIRGNKTVKGRRIAHKQFYNVGLRPAQSFGRLGKFVVIAQKNHRINARQLEASRRLIKKVLGNKGAYISVTSYPFAPTTRRPQDVRMGKGKGSRINNWICPVKKGRRLFEVFVNELSYGSKPLPLQTISNLNRALQGVLKHLRIKLSVPVRVLQLSQ